jgi:hypothetical protein
MSKLKPGALGAIAFFSVGLCFVKRAGIATDEAALESPLSRDWRVVAVMAFCVGALPLIVDNLAGAEKFATVRSNMHRGEGLSRIWFAYKLRELESTWNGSAPFRLSGERGSRPAAWLSAMAS